MNEIPRLELAHTGSHCDTRGDACESCYSRATTNLGVEFMPLIRLIRSLHVALEGVGRPVDLEYPFDDASLVGEFTSAIRKC